MDCSLYAVESKFIEVSLGTTNLDTAQPPVGRDPPRESCQANRKRHVLRSGLQVSVKGNTALSTLVIVNPKSGVQKAQEIFDTTVKPMLDKLGCSYDCLVTKKANHARAFVTTYPSLVEEYDKVIIVSGDGLVHEVYQGLASRSDSNQSLKIPLAMIPGGSGNALSKSVAYFDNNFENGSNEKRSDYLERCSQIALNGQVTPMDLARVKTVSGEVYTSFMSFGMGLLSDIDIDSESLRALGELRFAIYGILKGIQLKSYRVRITYVRMGEADATVDEDDFVLVQCVTKPWMAETLLVAPGFRSFNDGHICLVLIRKGVSRKSMFSWFLYQDKGYHVDMPYVSIVPVTWVRIEPATKHGNMTIDGEVVDFGSVEAEILHSAGNVMTSKNLSE